MDVGKWAEHLLAAESRRTPVALLTEAEPQLTVEDAYAVQDELISRRRERGEVVIGAKLGLTSHAKQAAMGVAEPIYGVLTDVMVLPMEQPLVVDELLHPRAEPEIVFVLADDLSGPGITAQDVLRATETVCCGLEVIDSRYVDFSFTLPDVIADNASASRLVLGSRQAVPDFDLALVGCVLEVNGEVVDTAAGAAVLGHPAEAVARLANWLGDRGQHLQRGWKVFSGALTNAVPLRPGTSVTAGFARLGRVGLRAI